MPLRSHSRRVGVIAAAVLLMSACGGDDSDDATEAGQSRRSTSSSSSETTTTAGETTTSAPSTPPPAGDATQAPISLTIYVTGDGAPRQATLSCGDPATGAGFLADPGTAAAACDLLRTNADAVRRLTDGPNPDLLCIELYGGPEVAAIQGEIDGLPVQTSVDRSDGCGIADWDMLDPMLAPAT